MNQAKKPPIAKYLKVLLSLAVLLGVLFLFLKFVHPFGYGPWIVPDLFKKFVLLPLKFLFKETLLGPYIYLALGITLLLEYLIPADPKQKILSASFFQDMVWLFYETMSDVFINIVYINGLRWAYHTYFSFLTIQNIGQWPYGVRFALGILLLDFLYWAQHLLNHKVPWLWELHALHHSQKEINFFTDFRYHMFEYFVRKTILVVPFLIFAINTPTIVIFSIVTTWYTRFYHGNIRTNMGFLRHIFVTPQSHRVHHSRLLEHRDLNFGSLFCIWDRIFRTQYYGHTEYPETGIDDSDFPHEHKDLHPFKVVFMPIWQMTYPFIKFVRKIKNRL